MAVPSRYNLFTNHLVSKNTTLFPPAQVSVTRWTCPVTKLRPCPP